MFGQLLAEVTASTQTQANIITDGQRTVTYGELPSILQSLGNYLTEEIDPAHSIALECPNSVPSALTILSLMDRKISFSLLPQVQNNQSELKPIPQFCRYRVVVSVDTSITGADWPQHPERFLTIEKNPHFQPPAETDGIERVYLRTSGSMGTSKIVVHSHDNFVVNAHNCVKKYALKPDDRAVVPIPLAHIYGLAGAFLPAFAAGSSIDLQSNTNHIQYLDREKSFQPNVAFLTPTICDMLLNSFSTPRSYKVVVTSAQRIGDELFSSFDEQIGGTLINMYGSSELGTTAGCDPSDSLQSRLATIGQPLETAHLRIQQPDPDTGIGELQCQNRYSFIGYVDEEGNWLQRSPIDEWFSTGDLATVNEEGEIRLVGRAKNSINRSGYLVLFSDIERIMEGLDDISQAIVVASAEENERGQAIVAFCIPKPGSSLNSQELRQDCSEKLPTYAIPDEVRIMASLPLLPSGKVDQQALIEQAQSSFQEVSRSPSEREINSVEDVIYVLTHLMVEELDVKIVPTEIDPDSALLNGGVNLDSIGLVRLITLIKEAFGLRFRDDELDMETLQSVRTFSQWIYDRLNPQSTAANPPTGDSEKKIGYYVQHLRAHVSLLHMRASAFGISHYDLLEANQNAHDPASWSAGLVKFAQRYESAAQNATAAQQIESARQWWQMAVNYYHFVQMFLEGEERKAYQAKCWQAYTQLASFVEPHCQRVVIPFQEMALPGYLRIAQPGAPCIILLGGFEFSKEAELHQWGEYFLKRGISVLAFDGPGQGEIANESHMCGDFENVVAAAIDFLESQIESVDATRIGLFGVSLGGYMALRATAMEDRVTACISLSGPFDGSTTRNLALRNQQVTARLFGFDDVEQLIDPAGPLNLATLPQAVKQPLFLIHSTLDHIVPVEQVELIQDWAQGKTELWMLEDVEHCCFSRSGEVMPRAGDWMARELGVGRG